MECFFKLKPWPNLVMNKISFNVLIIEELWGSTKIKESSISFLNITRDSNEDGFCLFFFYTNFILNINVWYNFSTCVKMKAKSLCTEAPREWSYTATLFVPIVCRLIRLDPHPWPFRPKSKAEYWRKKTEFFVIFQIN